MQKVAEKEALQEMMEKDDSIVVMGEGIIYKRVMYELATDLQKRFGGERVFDTPISETGLAGIATGMAMNGMHVLYMHDRADFLFLTMDQIVNHATKLKYMSGGQVSIPLVLWAIISQGKGNAAQHSQSVQGIFMQVPGITIVMPSSPLDAKGLLKSAMYAESTVLFLEHRTCLEQEIEVEVNEEVIPLGKGHICCKGCDVTIIAVSVMVLEALKAANILLRENIYVEVLDLRTVKPYDKELILQSVKKTKRAVIADTSWITGSIAKEISDFIYYNLFSELKAPIEIVACPDVPAPSSRSLEQIFYKDANDIVYAVKKVIR